MSGRQEERPATPGPGSAGASSGGAPLAARGEALMAKKMCEMFDKVQGGLDVTSTFNLEGVVEVLAVSLEHGKTTATDAAPQESGDRASGAGAWKEGLLGGAPPRRLLEMHNWAGSLQCFMKKASRGNAPDTETDCTNNYLAMTSAFSAGLHNVMTCLPKWNKNLSENSKSYEWLNVRKLPELYATPIDSEESDMCYVPILVKNVLFKGTQSRLGLRTLHDRGV